MIDPGTSAGKEFHEGAIGLPPIECVADFCAVEIPEPAQIIKGALHRGSKLVFGGPSKAFKSWNLIDLCLAVATGEGWLGWPTMDNLGPGRALYINLELQPFAIQRRIKALCEARNVQWPVNMDVWNLRGKGVSMLQLLQALPDGATYDLIVPDPIYKLYGPQRKENDLSDMAALMSEIEEMADITGAAMAMGAHFAKGLASAKEHLDRVSGSGVFARDPDTFVTATPHQDEDCFSIELTARNFPPTPAFVAEWTFPQMVRKVDGDPTKLKKITGRPCQYKSEDILKYLKPGMKTSEWRAVAMDETGMSKATFHNAMKALRDSEQVINNNDGWTSRIGDLLDHEIPK